MSTHQMGQVCKGMEVRTADGHKLGRVADVWYRTDPTASNPRCDDDVGSRLEVHHGVLGRSVLYVPYRCSRRLCVRRPFVW